MRNYKIFLLLPFLALSLTNSAQVMVVKRSPDFKVTGNGKAGYWEKAEWVNIPQRTFNNGSLTTKVKALYSGTGIYFLFYCQDKILTSTMNVDFMHLWNEDVVEVFLWTNERFPVYFEYELSPLNYELPILVSNEHGDIVRWIPFLYNKDRMASHATVILGKKISGSKIKGWMAEFYIPYKLLRPLTNIQPKPGSRWRINLYRKDYDKGVSDWSWQAIDTSSHEYKKFGILLFD